MSKRVFISYSTKDKETALKVKKVLEEHGIKVTIDRRSLKVAEKISDFIVQSISETDVTLLIVSKHSLKSEWVALETLESLAAEKYIKDKKFIACYLDDSFIAKENYLSEVLSEIDSQVKNIELEIDKVKAITGNYPRSLIKKQERNKNLLTILPDVIYRLQEFLTLDIREPEFDESLDRIIAAIKSEATNHKSSNTDVINYVHNKIYTWLSTYKEPKGKEGEIYKLCNNLFNNSAENKTIAAIIADQSKLVGKYTLSGVIDLLIHLVVELEYDDLFNWLLDLVKRIHDEHEFNAIPSGLEETTLFVARKKILEKMSKGNPPFYLSFVIYTDRICCYIHDGNFNEIKSDLFESHEKKDANCIDIEFNNLNISDYFMQFYIEVVAPILLKQPKYKGLDYDQVYFRFYLNGDQIRDLQFYEILDPRYEKHLEIKLAHKSPLTVASYERAVAKEQNHPELIHRWNINWSKISSSNKKIEVSTLSCNCDNADLDDAVEKSQCILFNHIPSNNQIDALIKLGACFILWPSELQSKSIMKNIKTNFYEYADNGSLADVHAQFLKLRKQYKGKIKFVIFWDDADRNALAHLQNDFFETLDQ